MAPVTRDQGHRNLADFFAPNYPQLVPRLGHFEAKALVGGQLERLVPQVRACRPDRFRTPRLARDYCSATRGLTSNGRPRHALRRLQRGQGGARLARPRVRRLRGTLLSDSSAPVRLPVAVRWIRWSPVRLASRPCWFGGPRGFQLEARLGQNHCDRLAS